MWRWRGPQDTHGFFSELFIKVCFFSFFPFLFVFDCITQHEGILAPQPVIKPVPSALGVWSLDCYTTREVPRSAFFFFFFFIFLLLIPNLGHDDDCHHSFSRQWRRPLLRMLEPMENLVGDIVCILRLIDTLHMSTRKKNRTDFDYHFSCTIGFHD